MWCAVFAMHSNQGYERGSCSNVNSVFPSPERVMEVNLLATALPRNPVCRDWSVRDTRSASALFWELLWVLGWVAAKDGPKVWFAVTPRAL